MQLPSFVRAVLIELSGRHRFRPRGGRSTNTRIECSVVYTLRCHGIFMARITSRDTSGILTPFIFGCRRLYHGYTESMFAPIGISHTWSALVRDIHVLTYSVWDTKNLV